jgi:hypothetical protein
MAEYANIDRPTWNRVSSAVRTVEQRGVDLTPLGNPHSNGGRTIGRWARLTKCANSTGYAEAQFTSGPADWIVDTSQTIKVFLGVAPFADVPDDVAVIPIASPDLHWVVVAYRYDPLKRWALEGTLATTQLDPDADTNCDDTVSL